MNRGKQERAEQHGRARQGRRSGSGSLVAHAVFAPLIGLWGAALGGLVVLVLPPPMIAGLTRSLPGAEAGLPVQPMLAGLAALVLGGVLFVLAAALTRRARHRAQRPSIAEFVVRRVRPIDPQRDLGSRSLDEPIEAEPFATPAWRDAEEADPAPEPESEPALADTPAGPRALDLAEFGALPGRNAVWVEEAPVVSLPQPVSVAPEPVPAPGTAALARLRATPPSELSLAQMVERFAGALHEHRAVQPARALSAADLAAREAALAEALKALASLSGDSAGTAPAGSGEAAANPVRRSHGAA
jgi:hypothetical protein